MKIDLPSLGATKLASAPRVGRVRRIHLDSGGYTRSGQYYGTGGRLYAADIEYQVIAGRHSDTPFIEYEETIEVRAGSVQDAKEQILEIARNMHGRHGGM